MIFQEVETMIKKNVEKMKANVLEWARNAESPSDWEKIQSEVEYIIESYGAILMCDKILNGKPDDILEGNISNQKPESGGKE